MIKGVNKRVVEITGTDNEYFEKAVLYVKADKCCVPAERINEEAREYLERIVPMKKHRTLFFVLKLLAAALAVLLVLLILYLIFV